MSSTGAAARKWSSASRECEGGVSRLGTKSTAVVTSIGIEASRAYEDSRAAETRRAAECRAATRRAMRRRAVAEPNRHHLSACKAGQIRNAKTADEMRSRLALAHEQRRARCDPAARERTGTLDVETVELRRAVTEVAGNGDVRRSDRAVNAKVRRIVRCVARTTRNQRARDGNCGCKQPGRLRARGRAKGG